jgi:glycosyltransferase involved in cell wall biosynthesis
LKKIYFSVTNDLVYDQRMARICGSLTKAGFEVTLVGRKSRTSIPLRSQPYRQIRLNSWFRKGKLFYFEYNLRLFFFLAFQTMDAVCCIDLDTILPCLFVSKLRKIPRVYDAHELFCEMKEVVSRPFVHGCWKIIERAAVPAFRLGYTVSQPIADEFRKMYAVDYAVIRNTPLISELDIPFKKEKYILYQGAVNEGRSFETLIPAMKNVDSSLIICGDGNFMKKTQNLVKENKLEKKVLFKGALLPSDLLSYTRHATIGVTLFEKDGKSNYYSLANRFFDYMHAVVPQVCVNYPAYRQINDEFKLALLVDDLSPESISAELNKLLNNAVLYNELKAGCLLAREVYNWQEEEKKLILFYKKIFE